MIKNKSVEHLISLYDIERDCYTELGDFKSAYSALEARNKQEKILHSMATESMEIKNNVELEIEELKANNQVQASSLRLSQEKERTNRYMLVGSLILLVLASVLFYTLNRSYKLKKQRAEDQLKTTRKIQEERFKLAEKEKEVTIKQEIAAELHDNILSSLSGIRLSAEQLLISAAVKDEKSNRILTNLEKNIKTSYRTLKGYVDELRFQNSPIINTNILFEVEDFIKSTLKQADIEVVSDVSISHDLDQLSDTFQINIIRILKELLNNVIKHSGATFVNTKLQWKQGSFHFTLYDNGKGFDTGGVSSSRGLKNVRDRVKALNGVIDIISNPGEGTIIDLEFKL